MKLRKTISLTAFVSLFFVFLTSIVLYLVPHGRIAYWADWRLAGLSKEQWTAIHINIGIVFVLSLFFHVYYNWRPLTAYMKNKAKNIRIFTGEFNLALSIVLFFVLSAYFEFPPASWIMNINDSIKQAAETTYGSPPYGHAELSSLRVFTRKMGLDLEQSKAALQKAGFVVETEEQTLKQISRANNVAPRDLYRAILKEVRPGRGNQMKNTRE